MKAALAAYRLAGLVSALAPALAALEPLVAVTASTAEARTLVPASSL